MAAFAAPLIGMGISALSGLFGNKKPQQQMIDQTSTSTPNLDPQQALLKGIIGNEAINNYRNGPGDLSAYTAGGLQDINKGADFKSKAASNILASRGLSFSPSGVQNLINPEADRLQQSTSFLSQIPLLKRQFQQQNLQQLMQSFGIMPTSTTTTTKGTTTAQGNPVAGTLSGAGQGLFAALPFLMGSMNKGNTGKNDIPGGFNAGY